MTKRFDRVEINYQAKKTKEGFLVDTPILTRVGVFDYMEDGKVIKELRPPEEVFKADSLQSMKNKPVIHTHEAGMVHAQNAKGNVIGSITTDGKQDGDYVLGEVVVYDTSPIDQGDKELSMGYSCDLIDESGEWNGHKYDRKQTNIQYNHVAIVKRGRAGVSRFNLDAAQLEDWFNEKGDNMTPEEKLKQEKEQLKAENQKLKSERDQAQAKADSLEADKAKFDNDKLRQDALNEALQVIELVNEAKSLKLDASINDKPIDLKKKIIKSVKGDDIKLDDKSEDYINAVYDICKADIKEAEHSVEQQRKDAVQDVRSDEKQTSFKPMNEL